MTDRGYTNLLTHLHAKHTSLPLNTISGSLAHYLSILDPSPTPLAATVISSTLFTPLSHVKLSALSTAFRHAVHLKHKSLSLDRGLGLFTRGWKVRLGDWVRDVLKGFEGGTGVLRLACLGGLLLGLGDLGERTKLKATDGRRGEVENEVVVAVAEVMELHELGQNEGWEKAFEPVTEQGEGALFFIRTRDLWY